VARFSGDILLKTQRRVAREDGSILVMTAVVLVVLLGMTALTLDAAYLYDLRNRMGAAADAAAVAASKELASTTNNDDLTRFGREAASRSVDINTVTVTVHHPPQNGPYNCTNSPSPACDDYVEAIVAQPAVPTFFMRLLGRTTMAVGNRAVASVKANLPHCMVALGTDPDAVMVTGGADLQATNCQIDSHGGINATGGELNTCTEGTHVCEPGGHLRVPGAVSTITTSGSGALYGAKDPNIPLSAMPDPFARLIDPTYAVTPCLNPTITNNLTLNPGTYCNGLSLGGNKGLKMNPGTYILLAGGFSNSSGGDVTGIGVTIYVAGGAIAIKEKATLKAPLTGAGALLSAPVNPGARDGYAAVLFWQPESNDKSASIKSGANGVYSGAFYLPKADIEFFAGSTSPCAPDEYRFVVAQGIKFSGSATFCNNVPGTLSGGIFGGAGLVE
jgi:Flp pilus assembly protein TadG